MTTLSIFCNPIDGRSKKGTSNFKLREYNAVPEEGRTEKVVDSHINTCIFTQSGNF